MAVESLWRDTSHSIDGYRPDDGMMNLPPDGWRVRLRTEESFGTGPAEAGASGLDSGVKAGLVRPAFHSSF